MTRIGLAGLSSLSVGQSSPVLPNPAKVFKMTPDELAEQHWDYTAKVMKLMYIEAFKHGYKHGKDEEAGK